MTAMIMSNSKSIALITPSPSQQKSEQEENEKKKTFLLSSPVVAFAIVSFPLLELGWTLNSFQGIYLVFIGWNEGSVGIALALRNFVSLIVQTFAGDIVDKAKIDRRVILSVSSIVMGLAAFATLLIPPKTNVNSSINKDHIMFLYTVKIIEGIAFCFIGQCIAALTLASFGPTKFDNVMASNILWGHIGSVIQALTAGYLAYSLYPNNTEYCFLVFGLTSIITASAMVWFLPEGDTLLGRGLAGRVNNVTDITEAYQMVEEDCIGNDVVEVQDKAEVPALARQGRMQESLKDTRKVGEGIEQPPPKKQENVAATYWEVFTEKKTCVLCLTAFFFDFANLNVLLVLGELMGRGGESYTNDEDGTTTTTTTMIMKRSAIPYTAGAIATAQLTMSAATFVGDKLTEIGCGRKILFISGMLTLPIRCALIILFKDAGGIFLLWTELLDGVGGGLFSLLHPYLVADITFGTGRFNVVMGLTTSFFLLGATLSNLLGQYAVEKLGHVASLLGSFVLSIIASLIFALFMPETYGQRRGTEKNNSDGNNGKDRYGLSKAEGEYSKTEEGPYTSTTTTTSDKYIEMT